MFADMLFVKIGTKTMMPELGNRKPVRSLNGEGKDSGHAAKKARKPTPPDQTNAENFYYIKQMQSKTPMVIVLKDGEELHGVIEWYDKASLKVNRLDGPNLLVYKSNIKYMYKAAP